MYSDLQFYNNTLLNPSTGGSVLGSNMTQLSGYVFQNNLIYAPTAPVISTWTGFSQVAGMTLGHNVWSATPTSSAKPGSGSNDVQANLKGANDIVTTSPGLANPSYRPAAGGLYDPASVALIAGSVARGAGVTVPAVTADFFGTSRVGKSCDVGAFQH